MAKLLAKHIKNVEKIILAIKVSYLVAMEVNFMYN